MKTDSSLFERTIEAELRARGLAPVRQATIIDVRPYERLMIERQDTGVAETDISMRDQGVASIGVSSVVAHPRLGLVDVGERITSSAATPEQAIRECARVYLQVTFPALESIFTRQPARGLRKVNIELTASDGGHHDWELFCGHLETGGPDGEEIAAGLTDGRGMRLVWNTLVETLGDGLVFHWVRLVVDFSDGNLEVDCVIDGTESAAGAAEVSSLLGGAPPGKQGRFRYFFVACLRGALWPA